MSEIANFRQAIDAAEKYATELMPGVTDLKLEGVMVTGKDFEVTLSYYVAGKSPLELSSRNKKESMGLIAALMTTRREYKVFLVDKHNFSFKGFKAYKEQ